MKSAKFALTTFPVSSHLLSSNTSVRPWSGEEGRSPRVHPHKATGAHSHRETRRVTPWEEPAWMSVGLQPQGVDSDQGVWEA